MTFAQKLRAERKRLGISQPQLAEILEVSFRVISNWEREFTTPPAITQEGALARLGQHQELVRTSK